jgi:exo-1,4-beta-D-glucosaminidase
MLNNAWPSMIWHLYDWYMRPGGSYFGAKKANEPLHIQYSYDDASVVVVNSFYKAYPGMKARAWVYNIDMSEKFAKDAALDVGEDSSTRVLTIPAIDGLSSTYFVRLALEDSSGKTVSTNFYWLSTKPDDLDWDRIHLVLHAGEELCRLHRPEQPAAGGVEVLGRVRRCRATTASRALRWRIHRATWRSRYT